MDPPSRSNQKKFRFKIKVFVILKPRQPRHKLLLTEGEMFREGEILDKLLWA